MLDVDVENMIVTHLKCHSLKCVLEVGPLHHQVRSGELAAAVGEEHDHRPQGRPRPDLAERGCTFT